MIDYIVAGGPVMVPILLCSVVALATFLERLWFLRRPRVVPHGFVAEVTELVRQRRWGDALRIVRSRDVAVARILEVAIVERDQPRPAIKERLEEVGRREATELERYVPVLGTVASIGPLLGLLGTVGGMIMTFQVIQDQGMGDVANLAGGISQALITTFAGLSVGIPALVANRYLLSRVDQMLVELEEVSLGVLQLLVAPQGQDEPASDEGAA